MAWTLAWAAAAAVHAAAVPDAALDSAAPSGAAAKDPPSEGPAAAPSGAAADDRSGSPSSNEPPSSVETPSPAPDTERLEAPRSPASPLVVEHSAGATGPMALDVVLASGVRLIAAQDESLPVAAVVLAIETGTVDDPPEFPGLMHALAYHLLQGNRELAPGASVRAAHDAGGLANLVVSAGQIRFESLVPLPALNEILAIEAVRLRAPTLAPTRWENALTWASRDSGTVPILPWWVVADLHHHPGLAQEGRAVTQELLGLPLEQVGQALAQRFRYARATLIVVAPHAPLATLATVQALFADLPPADRIQPERGRPERATSQGGAGMRTVDVEGARGDLFAWPIEGSPAAILEARVACRALHRQRRDPADGPHKQVRCVLDPDPRYPTLLVQVTGSADPVAVLEARLRRLEDAAALEREAVAHDLTRLLDRPLPLAQQLATTRPSVTGPHGTVEGTVPLASLTGLQSLMQAPSTEPLADRFALDLAVRLMPLDPSP